MWQGGVGQGVAEGVAWAVVGVSMVVLNRGMEWEVSRRVLGCRWWWSEGVLWKVVLLDVAGDVWWYRGVVLVEVDCWCGWKASRRVLFRVSPWCIANVVEGVACVAYQAIGFPGALLVVFDYVGGVAGGAWLRLWLGGVAEGVVWVSLVVFDRGFGWEVLCWEVAWRVSGGVWIRVLLLMLREWDVAGGVVRDVFYRVDFLVLRVSHICSRILQMQWDCEKKDTVSWCFMLFRVYAGIWKVVFFATDDHFILVRSTQISTQRTISVYGNIWWRSTHLSGNRRRRRRKSRTLQLVSVVVSATQILGFPVFFGVTGFVTEGRNDCAGSYTA